MRLLASAFFVLLLATAGLAQDPPHNTVNGIECDACHTIHNAPGAHYTTIQGSINLCQSCHNPLGVLPVSTHSPAGVGDIACTDCHNPHTQEQEHTWGSTFSKLVRTTIATTNSGDRAVKLLAPSGPNSFADGDTVYDGVCEVCHTQTAHHRNNSSGDHLHNAAADCTQCHPHEDGFQPTGGDCLACHNQRQPPGQEYRRQIVENNGDGGGDFVRLSHHVDDGSGQESVTAGDCTVCHDQSAHQSHPDPEVLLSDPDGGASHTFDGTAASVTGFCLGCHDGDGQGGNLTPFSDGQTPPDVDQWWSNLPAHASTPFGLGCWNCHRNGHGSDNPSLTAALEENLCFSCHNGTLAQENILSDFQKPYSHPLGAQSLVHQAGEDPLTMPRHVECQDCHNPHAADGSQTSTPPATPGTLLHVDGVDTNGAVVADAANGFEVCYKCHADTNPGNAALPRMQVETNLRVEFDPAQPSFHPIEAAGKNQDMPSLTGGWTKASIMECWDCHAGDNGILGPHGSNQPWILKYRYETADNTQESAQVYALCYTCHDRASILGDQSFKEHSKHIENLRTPCSVCHDAHGATSNGTHAGTHLVNFRTDVVSPNNKGDLWFRDDGRFKGACALRCHGKDHGPKSY